MPSYDHVYECLEVLAEITKGGKYKVMIKRILGMIEKIDIRHYCYNQKAFTWQPSSKGVALSLAQVKEVVLPSLMAFFKRSDPVWYDSYLNSLNNQKTDDSSPTNHFPK